MRFRLPIPIHGRRTCAVLLLVALAFALGGCGASEDTSAPAGAEVDDSVAPAAAEPAEFGRDPHILLVVIDTLRADHVGAYGYDRPTTPNLDALAAEGVLFANALSNSSWTKPAVASLFTGLFPSEHGAVAFGQHLSEGHPTLAGLLSDAGYLTLGVSANFVHVSKQSGLDRGFESWKSLSIETDADSAEAIWQAEGGDGAMHHFRPARATEVNEALLAMLPDPVDRPLFLYAHYMEPHSDYAPPAELRERFVRAPTERFADGPVTTDTLVDLAAGRTTLSEAERQHAIDLYDAEIAAADAALAELLSALDARGIDPLVVVTSDHGESFGEHGSWFHGIDLHRESLAVPLVIRDPARGGQAERHDAAVSLVDVAPTLLERARQNPPRRMKGKALLSGRRLPAERGLIAELHPDPPFEEHVVPRTQRLAVQRGVWKLLLARDDGTATAYRVDQDPQELEPLGEDGEGAPPTLVHSAKQFFVLAERRIGDSEPVPLTERELQGLRALGYVDDEAP